MGSKYIFDIYTAIQDLLEELKNFHLLFYKRKYNEQLISAHTKSITAITPDFIVGIFQQQITSFSKVQVN